MYEFKMAATTSLTKCSQIWSGKKLLTSIRLSSFQALGINGVLVEKLAKLGIKHPSEIQENVRKNSFFPQNYVRKLLTVH